DYFKKVYSPENYIATIVGNADFEKVCSYLEKSFKKGGKKPELVRIIKRNGESFEEREGIDQAHLVFAFHAPLMGSHEFNALEVFDAYLANGMSSRLFLKIREEKGLAYSVKSSISAEKNYSYYSIYIGTTKEAVPEVKKIILEELKNAKKMTEKDLQESKERVIGLKKVSSEESLNVMNELLFAEITGDVGNYYKYEENIRKVSLEDVQKFSDVDEYSFAVIVPK
ncbi:MAG TPA: insulinase family protein, partial [Candidatus Nanoarchaeia archaeon]|nr:insulinase family protein [Candidatus Nanoarchaeia archaeon]